MLYFSILLYVVVLEAGASDLIVETENGKVQGGTYATPTGVVFYSWRGIPFGKPPLGELRFESPQKPDPWDSILNATVNGPACRETPGYPKPTRGYSEDCLYLNVYSPRSTDEKGDLSLPVMFWVHGGSFVSGHSDFKLYDPTPFLSEDVIVVTSNYRLGVFGFLSTGDDAILGNAGLKDQLLALQWTKANIASFGGNSENITVFGESAGARSVGFHLVSNKSRDLFSAVIMESTNAMSYFAIDDPKKVAYNLARKFDTNVNESSSTIEVKNVLKNVSADQLYEAGRSYTFGPVWEVESDDAFVTKPVYESLASGDFAKVPTIMGNNLQESLSFFGSVEAVQNEAAMYDQNPEKLIPTIPLKDGTDPIKLGEEIRKMYAGENGTFSDNLSKYLNWWNDDRYVRSVYKGAMLQSQYAPVYMYHFSFYGTASIFHINIPDAGKIGHADELAYLFNMTIPLLTEADYLTRQRMVKLWTNFAKTHNPTPEGAKSDPLGNIKWNPITIDDIQLLDIGVNLTMILNPRVKLNAFWDHFWDTYSYHPYNTY